MQRPLPVVPTPRQRQGPAITRGETHPAPSDPRPGSGMQLAVYNARTFHAPCLYTYGIQDDDTLRRRIAEAGIVMAAQLLPTWRPNPRTSLTAARLCKPWTDIIDGEIARTLAMAIKYERGPEFLLDAALEVLQAVENTDDASFNTGSSGATLGMARAQQAPAPAAAARATAALATTSAMADPPSPWDATRASRGCLARFNKPGLVIDVASALRWPPATECPAGMRPPECGEITGGNDFSQKPVPHIRGEESEGNFTINRGCRARTKLDAYSQAGGIVTDAPTNPQTTIENMMAWMYARDDLRRLIHGVELRESNCPAMNDSGFRMYVTLNGQNPQANTPVEAFDRGCDADTMARASTASAASSPPASASDRPKILPGEDTSGPSTHGAISVRGRSATTRIMRPSTTAAGCGQP